MIFVGVPLLALIAAVPLAWGWGLGWTDIGLATPALLGGLISWPWWGAFNGVLCGQVDISAQLISSFEKLGWVSDVRWPTSQRLTRISPATNAGVASGKGATQTEVMEHAND